MPFYLFTLAAAIIFGTLLSPLYLFLFVSVQAAIAITAFIANPPTSILHWRKLFAITLAVCFGFGWLQWQLAHRLPVELDKQEVSLRLYVVENIKQQGIQRLLVKVMTPNQELDAQKLPHLRNLKLSLYRSNQTIKSGSLLNAEVVLRSPRNIANGLAFDYEAWLISQGVDATGYIKQLDVISEHSSPLRDQIIKKQQLRHPSHTWPWIAGLVFGEQDSFTTDQWQLSKQMGTLHLLVVSGLHMGLVLFLLVVVWRTLLRVLSSCLGRSLPSLIIYRLIFLLAGSAGYLWLAGSGVALQRAWLMFSIVLLIQSTRLKLNWLTAISLACLLVVFVNPLIWTGPGFAYSFAAVLTLLLFFSARRSDYIEAIWLPQWVIFIALIPVFISWQQPVSLVQWLANLLAIPYVSLVLLPLSLLNIAFPYVPLSFLLESAGDLFWWLLDELSFIPLSRVTYLPLFSLFLWPLWLLVFRRGVSYFVTLLLSVMVVSVVFLFPAQQKPVAMMIDVGQGQSLVFTTNQHTIVYDAGPFMGQFDTGDAVITPVLYQLGVRKIDNLIVSHNDNDHAGGTGALLNNFTVVEWSGGQFVKNLPHTLHLCSQSSANWQVLSNNLLYRYLMVDESAWLRLPDNNNNRSCVVQLEWYGTRFLLTGDIGKSIEYDLIRKYNNQLKSDVLVLAHHGSSTSTSEVFLQTVAPKQVWISSGFNNKFNHPADDVIQRLHQQNIPWLNTAQEGAIVLNLNGKTITVRDSWQPPWRQTK